MKASSCKIILMEDINLEVIQKNDESIPDNYEIFKLKLISKFGGAK